MKKVLIVGAGGREASISMRLAEDSSVYAVMPYVNPTIEHHVAKTGGKYLLAQPTDAARITQFALENSVDLAFVSADEPLAAGVVDSLLAGGVRTVGPTREGARIEWDKEFTMNLMRDHFPEVTPRYWVATDAALLDSALDEVRNLGVEIVVKPQGLTGGKGVKVMGTHLADLDAAGEYARSLLRGRPEESVILVEKVDGVEFTMMVLTDGVSIIAPPATYDYPYRFDGDTGPGTGGMGAFSSGRDVLPFLSKPDYEKCLEVVRGVVRILRDSGRHFNGVLNAGFFITPEGIRFLEFNARFGDPECMNIMSVLDGSLSGLLDDIQQERLSTGSIGFSGGASVVKYLVTPEYALQDGRKHEFSLDIAALKKMGIEVFFSASVRDHGGGDNNFATVGNSRCVALAATAGSAQIACDLIERGIAEHFRGKLEWRRDVGSDAYIAKLQELLNIAAKSRDGFGA